MPPFLVDQHVHVEAELPDDATLEPSVVGHWVKVPTSRTEAPRRTPIGLNPDQYHVMSSHAYSGWLARILDGRGMMGRGLRVGGAERGFRGESRKRPHVLKLSALAVISALTINIGAVGTAMTSVLGISVPASATEVESVATCNKDVLTGVDQLLSAGYGSKFDRVLEQLAAKYGFSSQTFYAIKVVATGLGVSAGRPRSLVGSACRQVDGHRTMPTDRRDSGTRRGGWVHSL